MFDMMRHVLLLLLPVATVTLDNGCGRTPGLGWNSDYCEVNCSGPLALTLQGRAGAQPYAQVRVLNSSN
jgi:hypothetical protein